MAERINWEMEQDYRFMEVKTKFKYMKYILIGILLAGFITASAEIKIRTNNQQNPTSFKAISDTATTTAQIAAVKTIFLDSEFMVQGTCLKIKDLDGSGYTYLSTNKGVGAFSLISCE